MISAAAARSRPLPGDRQCRRWCGAIPLLSGSSTASVALSVSIRRVMSRAASRSTILSTDPVITAWSSRASLVRIALAQRSKDSCFDLTSRHAVTDREPQSAYKGFEVSERQVLRFSDGPARQVSFVHVEPVSEVHVFLSCYSPPFIREDENEG